MQIEAVPVPKYHRVKEVIQSRLADGTWPPGAMLPSEPELCREFGVSRITVRRAVSDLVHQGQLETVQGKGTFVTRPKVHERFVQRAFGIYEDMERRGLTLVTEVLQQVIVPAPLEVANRLAIRPGERVHFLERLRSVEGEKLLHSTTYIPEMLCPALVHDDLSSGSLYRLLERRYNIQIARGERTIEAMAADSKTARFLDVALASPLLLLDTVSFLPDGRPLEYSRVLHRGDRAQIEIEFFRVEDGR